MTEPQVCAWCKRESSIVVSAGVDAEREVWLCPSCYRASVDGSVWKFGAVLLLLIGVIAALTWRW